MSSELEMSNSCCHILGRRNLQQDNHLATFTAGIALILLFSSFLSISFYKNFGRVISDNFYQGKSLSYGISNKYVSIPLSQKMKGHARVTTP